jgi:hypothetical protein
MKFHEGMNKKERVSELLDELKNLLCDDDNWSDDENDWDDEEPVDVSDTSDMFWSSGLGWKQYAGALSALVNGREYRVRLMGKDYNFNEHHSLNYILPYEFTGEGYSCGVLIEPQIFQGRCLLPEVVFTGISGTLCGAVLCSDVGPISYVNFRETVLYGGGLTITSALGGLS